jgi:hypothetical protein
MDITVRAIKWIQNRHSCLKTMHAARRPLPVPTAPSHRIDE